MSESSSNGWARPQQPAKYIEQALITAILDGTFAPGDTLPGERALATDLGVTRPTLREALRRLETDGWLTIQQGKATQVRDYWQDGGMNLITSMVRFAPLLPADFIPNLLRVRADLAPSYAEAALRHNRDAVVALFAETVGMVDSAESYATFDWHMHRTLTIAANNPIYTWILNAFAGFYEEKARHYFAEADVRRASDQFYAAMRDIAERNAVEDVAPLVRAAMHDSVRRWHARAASQEG